MFNNYSKRKLNKIFQEWKQGKNMSFFELSQLISAMKKLDHSKTNELQKEVYLRTWNDIQTFKSSEYYY